MDILPMPNDAGLTPKTTFANLLLIVDAFSRFTDIFGLRRKTTAEVLRAMQQFAADHGAVTEFGYLDLQKIRADAGSQFIAEEFRAACREHRINLSLAAPKHQEMNHYAERGWQTIHRMALSMLTHA